MVIKIESDPEEKKRSSLLLLKELGSDCRGYRLVGMKDISRGRCGGLLKSLTQDSPGLVLLLRDRIGGWGCWRLLGLRLLLFTVSTGVGRIE